MPITGCLLFRIIRNYRTFFVYPQNVGVCCWAVVVGGASVAGAGASGHEKPSMPRVRGDSLVVTLIIRHGRWFFLNNLGIIPK